MIRFTRVNGRHCKNAPEEGTDAGKGQTKDLVGAKSP